MSIYSIYNCSTYKNYYFLCNGGALFPALIQAEGDSFLLSVCTVGIMLPPPEVCAHAAGQFDSFYEADATRPGWDANRRAIDRVNPGYEA